MTGIRCIQYCTLFSQDENILPPQTLHIFWLLSVDKDSLNYTECTKLWLSAKEHAQCLYPCSYTKTLQFYQSQDSNTLLNTTAYEKTRSHDTVTTFFKQKPKRLIKNISQKGYTSGIRQLLEMVLQNESHRWKVLTSEMVNGLFGL